MAFFIIQKVQVDVSGFRPEEITVELKDNRSLLRVNTARRVEIQKESIKCELDGGRLCITGMKTTGDGKRSIPIVVKKAVEQKKQQE
uniref:SHSP domain-containing protein n=1 Tax=Globodera rostochiensis TaxID=31243 RepID=A0A914HDA3_GLORO